MATKLDMAEQQLFGWHCAEEGERLIGLVRGMGLTLKEWDKLIEGGSCLYLSDIEREEITNYLSANQCSSA